jgi:hypothetical protein
MIGNMFTAITSLTLTLFLFGFQNSGSSNGVGRSRC